MSKSRSEFASVVEYWLSTPGAPKPNSLQLAEYIVERAQVDYPAGPNGEPPAGQPPAHNWHQRVALALALAEHVVETSASEPSAC
ncbi:MAG: hypothetical protein ACTHU0_02655 [Kofleriaceae bacterium]